MHPIPSNLLTEKDAAEYLSLSVKTLQQWRFLSKPPSYYKFGRSVRYATKDLEAFITSRKISPAQ